MGDICRLAVKERMFNKFTDKIKKWEDDGKTLIVISGGIPEVEFGSNVVIVDVDHLDDRLGYEEESEELYEECISEY